MPELWWRVSSLIPSSFCPCWTLLIDAVLNKIIAVVKEKIQNKVRLCTFGLFDEAVSSTTYTVFNCRMNVSLISDEFQKCRRKRSWPNSGIASTFPYGAEENHENPNQECKCSGRHSNRPAPEYQSKALLSQRNNLLCRGEEYYE
jgi:hypothetical protein